VYHDRGVLAPRAKRPCQAVRKTGCHRSSFGWCLACSVAPGCDNSCLHAETPRALPCVPQESTCARAERQRTAQTAPRNPISSLSVDCAEGGGREGTPGHVSGDLTPVRELQGVDRAPTAPMLCRATATEG